MSLSLNRNHKTSTTTTTTTATVQMSADRQLRIGYWWSEKKNLKINANELQKLLLEFGLRLVKLNLEEPLENQGPFEAIIHKLSDVMVKADAGDGNAKKIMTHFQTYCEKNPRMIVFDRLENVRLLIDRYRQYKQIEESEVGDSVFTPTFVELTTKDKELNKKKLKEGDIRYPFVCKPLIAHGCSLAHQMSLIFSEEGLDDITIPCVAQTFINHNARLFKLFVINDRYFTIERPSLKNFLAGNLPTVHFSSHDISKPNCSSSLTSLDKDDPHAAMSREPEKEQLDRIVKAISRQLGLYLYGIDVIIENGTGRYAIIDMNAFPGYDGVDNILTLVRDMLVEAVNEKLMCESKKDTCTTHRTFNRVMSHAGNSAEARKDCPCPTGESRQTHATSGRTETQNDVDSGIDTSDSCDEKNISVQNKSFRRQHSKCNGTTGTVLNSN